MVALVVEQPVASDEDAEIEKSQGLGDAALADEPADIGQEAVFEAGGGGLEERAFAVRPAHSHISLPDEGGVRLPAGDQAVYLYGLDEQEDGDAPEDRSAEIPCRNHQQAEDCIGRQDVSVVEHQVQDAEAQKQEHPPGETQGEVLALLLLVVPHNEEAESEEDGEDAVHLAGEQHREDIEHHSVAGKREGHLGRKEVEMLHGMIQDDADDGQAPKGVGHFDSAVLESLGFVHSGYGLAWEKSEDGRAAAGH